MPVIWIARDGGRRALKQIERGMNSGKARRRGRSASRISRTSAQICEGNWLAALDDFRNWLELGLEARERTMKIGAIGQNAVWERRDRD